MFYKKEIKLFESIVSRRMGIVRKSAFSSPILCIPSGDKILEVSFKKKSGKIHSVISCAFPEFNNYVMNLTPQDYGLIKIEVGYGVQDIVFNDKDFDRKYIVQGNQEDFVRNFLHPYIRQHLVGLKDLYPRTILKDGQFGVWVPKHLADETSLNRLIEAAVSMVNRLRELKNV